MPIFNRRPILALGAIGWLALSTPGHAQFATAPIGASNSPWARDYKACTDRTIMQRALERQGTLLSPEQVVALAEHDCASRLPLGGAGSDADNASVQLVAAAVHRDLMSRFPRNVTIVHTVPPIQEPTMMTVGEGAACPRPDYPPAALRAQAQGTTRVRLSVDPAGHVVDGDIVGSSGPTREHRLLDSTVSTSFRQCTFPPSKEGTSRQITLAYAWQLD